MNSTVLNVVADQLPVALQSPLAPQSLTPAINRLVDVVKNSKPVPATPVPSKPVFDGFWMKDDKGYSILPSRLMDFLKDEGFKLYFFGNNGSEKTKSYAFVKSDGNVLKIVSEVEIKRFVSNWIEINKPELKSVFAKNLVKYVGKNLFETMFAEFQGKLSRDTRDTVSLYYQNGILEITKDGFQLKPYTELNGFIWSDSIIKRDFIENTNSGEFEKFFKNVNNNDDERYNKMITAFGYMLHRYKNKADARAIIFNDESLEDERGGSGKGIIVQAVGKLRRSQELDMRGREKSNFIFQGVNPLVDVIHLEDVDKKFDFGKIFNCITSVLEIENKNQNIISIAFEDAPKIVISTNYAVKGNGDSAVRRKAEYELHKHYYKGYSPIDEFGHLLFEDWTDEEWNRFDTWAVKAVQHYLKNGLIEGETKTTEIKRLIEETSPCFVKFMDEWSKTMHFDCKYVKSEFYSDFIKDTDSEEKTESKNIVSKWLEKWAIYKKYCYHEDQKKIGPDNKRVFWLVQ
ncbi:MAG: hypothetical protein WC637_11690 [Victivallales bacterium]|jgi:hypothetical protein